MSDPLIVGNLAGTAENEFALGEDGEAKIVRSGDELGYQNPGEAFVPFEATTSGFNPGRLVITSWGGLVYDSGGLLVVKEVP